jgi:hypothetical protein
MWGSVKDSNNVLPSFGLVLHPKWVVCSHLQPLAALASMVVDRGVVSMGGDRVVVMELWLVFKSPVLWTGNWTGPD